MTTFAPNTDISEGPNPYDAAQSFNEQGLTVTTADTAVSGGSIGISDRVDLFNRSDDIPAGGTASVTVTVDEDLTDLISTTGTETSNVEVVSTQINGEVVGNPTRGETQTYDLSNYSRPYDVTAKFDNLRDAPRSYNWDVDTTGKEGSATIEWESPTDRYKWDVATFTASEDGETVSVFVAYSTDGGSTWTRTNGGDPVSRNYDLAGDSNISASDDVRIEAELTRENTANNPTLDSAYRTWIL